LRSPDGFPTGAIHGMVAMMKRLREQIKADHAACVFDAKGPTFRDALYPEYKAHRSPMPEDLVQQIEPIHEVVKLLGMVNATPDFADHPKVINGCSDLLVAVLGENGRHARSAVGMGSLPNNITVEIEAIIRLL
jgi:hypothetical protein